VGSEEAARKPMHLCPVCRVPITDEDVRHVKGSWGESPANTHASACDGGGGGGGGDGGGGEGGGGGGGLTAAEVTVGRCRLTLSNPR